MMAEGFEPLPTEWWHFTLKNEPYPETFFDFPVEALAALTNVNGGWVGASSRRVWSVESHSQPQVTTPGRN